MNPHQKAGEAALQLMGCMGGLASYAILAIYDGWVMSLMWLWFVVKQFAVAPISIPIAIGFGLILNYSTIHGVPYQDPNKSASERFWVSVLFPFGAATVTLIMGWIVHLFT